MPFKLITSGALRLVHSPDGETGFPEKGLMIMACMIASGQSEETRARISRLVWGDLDPARALTNLRQTIARITARQQQLGQSFLTFDNTTVRLDREGLSSDLDHFAALERADDGSLRESIARIITLYRLPFLAEIAASSGTVPGWIAEQQRAQANSLARAIDRCRTSATAVGDIQLLREAVLRVIRDDPDNPVIPGLLEQDGPAVDVPTRNATQSRSMLVKLPAAALPSAELSNALGTLRQLFDTRGEVPLAQNAPLGAIPRLALLPPGSGDSQGLVAALLEDVTIALCTRRDLRIVAPYTAARIGAEHDRPKLILQHAISYVLDTRIGIGSGEPYLFVQLVHVSSDEIVWAERFPLGDGLFLSQRIYLTQQLCAAISVELRRNEAARRYYEDNPQAYYHLLQGQSLLQHLTLPEIRRARKAFRAALQEKPGFGPALSGIARTQHLEWLVTARGDPELLRSAEKLAHQAIERCGELTFGYRELGVTKLFLGGFDESLEALSAAERLSPQFADVIADFGDTLIHASRPAEGLAKLEAAIALNPETPDGYLWAAAGACYYLEDYFGALAYIGRMQDKTPALRLAAACQAMLGDLKQARALSRKVRADNPGFDVDTWLSVVPIRENWQREHYREGLKKAGL